jgi:secernin
MISLHLLLRFPDEDIISYQVSHSFVNPRKGLAHHDSFQTLFVIGLFHSINAAGMGVFMCDTFAIGPECTGSGLSIFGKNSDREPDEAQIVVSLPRRTFRDGESLECTYISIPQVKETYAVVLSKPFWIWGAEMGVNEQGVVIGNEALFTKAKPEKSRGLIGMDLLRLALERADSAQDAAEVIISLLIRYGQAGPCGYRDKRFHYMNSFLIMDRKEIMVLETVGRDYALKRKYPFAAISNCLSLSNAWDTASLSEGADLCTKTDPIITFFAGSAHRRALTQESLLKRKGSFETRDAFKTLRSHFSGRPLKGFNRDVCMHASDPVIRKSQTTCSMVVELDQSDGFRIFTTAGSIPCITAFKPFLPAFPFEQAGKGGDTFSQDSYWWRHEQFSLNTLLRYSKLHDEITIKIQAFEEKYCLPFKKYSWSTSKEELVNGSHGVFSLAQDLEEALMKEMHMQEEDACLMKNMYRRWIAKKNAVQVIGSTQ